MTDDDLEELRRQTDRRSRLDEEAGKADTADFQARVQTALEELDAGDRQKTLSVWDGPLAAFVAALDEEDMEAVGTQLQATLGVDEDPAAIDRSEVLRLALRAGFREAAPEYLESAQAAVREHNTPDL